MTIGSLFPKSHGEFTPLYLCNVIVNQIKISHSMWHFWKIIFCKFMSFVEQQPVITHCWMSLNKTAIMFVMVMMMVMCKTEVSCAVLPSVKGLFRIFHCRKTLNTNYFMFIKQAWFYHCPNFTLYSWHFIYHLWHLGCWVASSFSRCLSYNKKICRQNKYAD